MSTDTTTVSFTAGDSSDSRSDLELVRAQFDEWRSRNGGRRHIPESLWAAAISLLERYPISLVSQRLRLNSARLRQEVKRQRRASTGRGKSRITRRKQRVTQRRQRATGARRVRGAAQSPVEFLQLSPTTGAGPDTVADVGCSIIVERVDGSRLTLRMPANLRIIESLWADFLS